MTFRRFLARVTLENMVLDRLLYRLSHGSLTTKIVAKRAKFHLDFVNQNGSCVSSLRPIIIGGCARSGTTLARALLGVHPDVASPQREWHIFLGKKYSGLRDRSRLKQTFGLSDEDISGLFRNARNRIRFIESLLSLYMENNHKACISLKNPMHLYFIDELFHFFPGARFVHVIRDGRDTVCSLRTHPKRKMVDGKFVSTNTRNPFDYCVRRWVSDLKWGIRGRRYDNYIEVKYEDLVNKTFNTMQRLYEFLELDMISEAQLLAFYKEERPESHPPNIEIGRPLYKGALGKWKRKMSSEEKQCFKAMAGGVLVALGYENSFDW